MPKNYILPGLLLAAALVISVFFYKSQDLHRSYKAEALKGLERTAADPETRFLTPDDTRHLPEPVRKYLAYVGVIGKEKVKNVRVVCDGEFKLDPAKDWVKVKTQQYNFFDEPGRFYFIQTRVLGVPVIGFHAYEAARAGMLIKLAGLITVAEGRGPEMDRGETVTVFNDMCLLAPASLIDQRIQWETIDPLTVKAIFDNNGTKISAVLYFNDKGELINFVSDDRFYSPTGKTFQKAGWSTPVKDYRDNNGFKLPNYAEAVWHFPEGDYCYARFNIREVEYNVKDIE